MRCPTTLSNMTSVTYLHPLDLELHVVLPRGLPVLPFLPAVAVPPVADLLPRVQQHRTRLRPKQEFIIDLAALNREIVYIYIYRERS